MFPGTSAPWNESSRELSHQGSKWELSLQGAKIPGSEKSLNHNNYSAVGNVFLLGTAKLHLSPFEKLFPLKKLGSVVIYVDVTWPFACVDATIL